MIVEINKVMTFKDAFEVKPTIAGKFLTSFNTTSFTVTREELELISKAILEELGK